ncbi:hypothetical protein HID58_081720, partial [Brassica napus]
WVKLLSGESFVVCVWVHRAHLFLGFWLLEGPLLWSCQVEPSQYPVAPSVFDGLVLSGEEFGSGSSKWFLSSPGACVLTFPKVSACGSGWYPA